MTAPILPVAEPWSSPGGGPYGVLVLHGFTGNPGSMRSLAHAFADAGFAVELPLLPGHGTAVEDMLPTTWDDWSAAAEVALGRLAARAERVVVAGLSMGGALTLWLATRHRELAGIVLVNAIASEPPGVREMLQSLVDAGEETMDAIGSDIARPDTVEASYDATPLRPMVSLLTATGELQDHLSEVTCPVLVMCSPQDHVVPTDNSDLIASSVSGPVERVSLDRSYHVATLDHDAELIEERAVAFARKVTAGS